MAQNAGDDHEMNGQQNAENDEGMNLRMEVDEDEEVKRPKKY
jgi:hypothetical protein